MSELTAVGETADWPEHARVDPTEGGEGHPAEDDATERDGAVCNAPVEKR